MNIHKQLLARPIDHQSTPRLDELPTPWPMYWDFFSYLLIPLDPCIEISFPTYWSDSSVFPFLFWPGSAAGSRSHIAITSPFQCAEKPWHCTNLEYTLFVHHLTVSNEALSPHLSRQNSMIDIAQLVKKTLDAESVTSWNSWELAE